MQIINPATLANDDVEMIGEKILNYDPLPAPKKFHASKAKFRWIMGGNRSGKSESCIGYDLCTYALNMHPVRKPPSLYDLNISPYTKTPKKVTIWAVSNSWPLVGKLLWGEKIKDYLPKSQIKTIIWHNKSLEIPEEIQLHNGNRIEFKAGEQTRKAFEGRPIDAIYQDEQIKSDSEGIFKEMQARLIDYKGFFAGSMTPLTPQPWLEEKVTDPPKNYDIFYADLNDNRKSRGGYIDDEEIDMMIDEWPLEVQETRIKGHFAAFLGAVYKTFNRRTHVIEPFKIPKTWTKYRVIDWGFNNPFACLWMARDKDRNWYVYREHYAAQQTLAFHAQQIKQQSKQESYRCTWADHDAQDRFEFQQLGINTFPAKKDIHLGIEAVQTALKVQGNGKPRLFIFNTCKNSIREMGGYKWAEGSEKKDAKDEPLQLNDHTCDCIRYAIYAVEGKHFFSESDLS
jgi:phage terminase large subunit